MINPSTLLENVAPGRFFPQGKLARTLLAACLAIVLLPSMQAAAQTEIDLKLFDSADVDRSKGCTVALWQADRSPQRDRFAYIFVEPLANRNAARQPARVRIGTQAVAFQRVATGGKTSGFGLSE